MGKRSDFPRIEKDFYPTPVEAVYPLIPHVGFKTFYEPCSGDGRLVDHLELMGLNCIGSGDISDGKNAFDIMETDAECFITNPPWSRDVLHPLIMHLSDIRPTWLLFDADWAYTKQSSEYMTRCAKIVPVGRVKWIPGSPHTGKDNCAWYLFLSKETETAFIRRVA